MGPDPGARARISGKVEFLEISEILPFGVDIADPFFRNPMIFVKHMGRYGYGGPPGPSPDAGVWAQIPTEALWCFIDVGLWQRILRCVVHLASRCSILPVDSDRVCHTLQVLWYSLSFGSCSRSSGIPFNSRGSCVCTRIVEVVVILFVVQLREAL